MGRGWGRAVGLGLLVALGPGAAGADEAPEVSGPVRGGTHGFPFGSTAVDLAAAGYVEEEFFVEGTARSWASDAPLDADGAWRVEPAGAARYRTRILVRRPSRAERHNGSVVVEWLNVSGGGDNAADWAFLHPLLLSEGYAWVGVSAQAVGVDGFPPDHPRRALGNAGALRVWDPQRYASLEHPGDSWAYDVFGQVGLALRRSDASAPLAGLPVRRLLAVGMSQSAARLVTYVNAVHPLQPVYDGFLVHARGARGAPLSQAPQADVPAPDPTRTRTDLEVPVLTFETETDLVVLDFLRARQPDSPRLRLWEVAGTAHTDVHQMRVTRADARKSLDREGGLECALPANAGPQGPVLRAALHALDRWVRDGTPPPRAPRLSVAPPDRIVRDGRGNALGGIRTPLVDVPLATLSGEGNDGGMFCRLVGVTRGFDAATRAALYPSGRAYLAAFEQSLADATAAGFVLESDAAALREEARAAASAWPR